MKISDFDAELYADHFFIIFSTRGLVFKDENKEKSLNILQIYENTDFKLHKALSESSCYGNSLSFNAI